MKHASTGLLADPRVHAAAGVAASAALWAACARGGAGWVLAFVAFVPWLRTLDASRTLAGTFVNAWAMSVAFTAAAFAWFGTAIGSYTQVGSGVGLAVLLVAAPLFQPQIIVFALVRHVCRRWHGALIGAMAAAAAWVATEWLVPKVLGDTLGYALYPSALLRQAADVGGAAGLTLLLLLANESLSAALARRGDGIRAMAKLLALAALVPLLLAGYGVVTLSGTPAPASQSLRMGLVQSNITDYERLRRERGAGAVVREVLDTHFAMSYDAVERQGAHAVLWSETVYPTTFSRPKSEAGAEMDREILEIVNAARVPFVFGTYDRDAAGEYNAAAFVAPGTGLLGMYRKTRLFLLTEHVPAWLDGPLLRRWLPWTGSWRPGDGARVFPLRLADGREIPVQPLICLDDTDAGLAIDGARLGAQALLTMSNDAWFTAHPQGAELHRAVAAFRSIETRLPQFRVTTNGYSAVIDANGSVVAGTRMGERTLVIGDVAVREPPRTLMVRWGDWVGRVGVVFLVVLVLMTALREIGRWRGRLAMDGTATHVPLAFNARVAVLPPAARLAAGALRAFARGSLLWMVAAVVFGDGALQTNTLAQIRTFAALFLAPEAAAFCVLLAFSARASIEEGQLVLRRGSNRLEIAVNDIAAVEPWRLPVPGPGVSLRHASGERWPYGLALNDPQALIAALPDSVRAPLAAPSARSMIATTYAQARLAIRRGRFDRLIAKFVLFPLVLAIPAFRLHQHIAYGNSFGEFYAFGLGAYLNAFMLWWAAWAIGVVLCAAALRATIEVGTLAAVLVRPGQASDARRWLERIGLVGLYVGLPGWLGVRLLAG